MSDSSVTYTALLDVFQEEATTDSGRFDKEGLGQGNSKQDVGDVFEFE